MNETKALKKFYEQLSSFDPPDSLNSTLFDLRPSIPISESTVDEVFRSEDKFLNFQAYVTTFVSNTGDYILEKNEAKDLRKITNDPNILNYWERLKFLIIIGTINGTPKEIPSEFTFGPWFHPIENQLKRKVKQFHLESVISFTPKTKFVSALPIFQKSWFEGKPIDITINKTSNPIIQRCAQILQDHPFDTNRLSEALTYTLEFQITASLYRLNAGDKDLSSYLRFYVIPKSKKKAPSILMETVFSEASGFPNASLAKILNEPSDFDENVKIQKFTQNFWKTIHLNQIDEVVDYLTKFIRDAQLNAKPLLKFDFLSQNNDINSYVIEMQLNIYTILQNEINIESLGFSHSFIYPKQWRILHPFYFDTKNNDYSPNRMYLPNVDIKTLPSYFVGPNLEQELATFHQLNHVLHNALPLNKNPMIYTNDNFWNKPNQIYHVIQFYPRPVAQIGFQNLTPKDINEAYKFEENVRNRKSSTVPAVPNFSNSLLLQWAQEVANKKLVGDQDLNLLLDVNFYFVGSKLGGLTKDVAIKMGISPFIIEILNLPQPQFPQPQPQPQLPQPQQTSVTEYFSSRKGRTRRSRSKRRRSPRRRPRRRLSRVRRVGRMSRRKRPST